MGTYGWHMLLARYMLDVAVDAIGRGRYVASAYALLVAFEEMMDAYSARDGKHFHDEYLADAWQKRVEWMREHGLLDRWEHLIHLCSKVVEGRYERIGDMLRLVKDMVYDKDVGV